MLLDLVNRIISERKVKKKLDIQVWVLSRSSRGRPESTSQGRPLNVALRRPLDVISRGPQDVRSGRPREGQIGSLGDVLGTLEGEVFGTSWGPIFAGWEVVREVFSGIFYPNRKAASQRTNCSSIISDISLIMLKYIYLRLRLTDKILE